MVAVAGRDGRHLAANLCLTPSFLAKLTYTDESIKSLLWYRAFDLFGCFPATETPAGKPVEYDHLQWADPLSAVPNAEAVIRGQCGRSGDRVAACARELGWLFSAFKPDPTL